MNLKIWLKNLQVFLKRKYNFYFRNWNYIFKFDHHSPNRNLPEELTVLRFDSVDTIPGEIIEMMYLAHGDRYVNSNMGFINSKGAVLWVAIKDNKVLGCRLSRRGKNINNWFIELNDNDIIIYRGNTVPEFRGHGLSPAMMQYIIKNELNEGDNAYVDCKIYNYPSIRSITKAGFVKIAKMRPIKEE